MFKLMEMSIEQLFNYSIIKNKKNEPQRGSLA